MHNYKLNQIVYHSEVYEYREPLKVVGIRETELELEGDYSGGTNPTKEKCWLPIEGTSYHYDYTKKLEAKQYADEVLKDKHIEDLRTIRLARIIKNLTENIK